MKLESTTNSVLNNILLKLNLEKTIDDIIDSNCQSPVNSQGSELSGSICGLLIVVYGLLILQGSSQVCVTFRIM